jgi:hypothetical protein
MTSHVAVATHFECAATYAAAFESYRRRDLNMTLDEADKEWPGNESWRVDH